MPDAVTLHSGEYVERYNRKPLDRVRGLARLMNVTDDAELADFACGNGMLAQVLGQRAAAYHGVDFSKDFINAARDWASRSQLKNCNFHCIDIIDFCKVNPYRFDVATTLDFSEHVDDRTAIAIYTAIRRSLKSGGTLYLHTPNSEFFLERAKAIGLLPQFPEHIAVRSGAQLRDLLVAAGFDRNAITVRAIAHYNVLKALHPLSYLPFLGGWFAARLWIKAQA